MEIKNGRTEKFFEPVAEKLIAQIRKGRPASGEKMAWTRIPSHRHKPVLGKLYCFSTDFCQGTDYGCRNGTACVLEQRREPRNSAETLARFRKRV